MAGAAAVGASTLFFRVAALLKVALVKVAILLLFPPNTDACWGAAALCERAYEAETVKGPASSVLCACTQ